MNYKDMNIFDKASIIKNLVEDDFILFSLCINGIDLNLCCMEVGEDHIKMIVNVPNLEIKRKSPKDELTHLKKDPLAEYTAFNSNEGTNVKS